MAPEDRDIPTGRIRRTATVAQAMGTGGARVAGATALDALRRNDRSTARLERSHLEAAQRMVEVLGSMKGAAMKVGQLASFVEVDFIPAEFRPLYQEALSSLRAEAPALPFAQMEKVLQAEWGGKVSDHLSDIDETAAAAASVGQVHRATTRDGREVAVKIQYPGIEEALRADLANVGLFTSIAKAIAPGLDARAVAAEVRERVLEEMDYELEAANQRTFARGYRGHPFIVVPEVDMELSRRRVLVGDWVEGDDFEVVRREGDEPLRSRVGEMIYRFAFGSIYHLGHFNADPHPGNYKLLPGRRLACLDFGSVKAVSVDRLVRMRGVVDAALEDDPEGLSRRLVELGYLARPDKIAASRILEHTRGVMWWVLEDREVTVDAPLVERVLAMQTDPRAGSLDVIRRGAVPAEDVMFSRLQVSVVAVLAQLRATRNWRRINDELWYGKPPATELGEAEWEYWTARGSRIDRYRAAFA